MMTQKGSSDMGISLAEMTLINAAPASQVAAMSATASSAAPPPEADGGEAAEGKGGGGGAKPDIEKLAQAQECYEEICRIIEISRLRSGGDPWPS